MEGASLLLLETAHDTALAAAEKEAEVKQAETELAVHTDFRPRHIEQEHHACSNVRDHSLSGYEGLETGCHWLPEPQQTRDR
jgi:hypothetical protein